MFKKKLMFPLLIVGIMICSSAIGAATYAFWSKTITVNNNTIKTGMLALELNGNDGSDQAGTTISVENLYPSYVHSVEKEIIIENTGSIELQYQLEFINVNEENQDVFDNVLVSFDDGETWEDIADVSYINPLLDVNSTDTLTVLFRLNPELEDLSTMNQEVEFGISVHAIQLEDTF